MEAHVAFDVDSLLGFGSSLQLARKKLIIQPSPQMRQNIKTDVHITMQVPSQPQQQQDDAQQDDDTNARQHYSHAALLRDIPHFQLGRLVGAEEVSLYVLFPFLH